MPDLQKLQDSVKAGDLQSVRTLLQAEPGLLNQTNESGQSSFLLANYYGRKDIADYLLSLGPELDVFTATVAGLSHQVVALIREQPALLGAHNSDGWTPLHLAGFFGRADLAAELLQLGADLDGRSTNAMRNTPLHAAVAGRKPELVKLLAAQGADVNATQTGGWTPLHGAAQNGDREIVEALLAHGAHAHAQADNNQTPLDLAMMKGHGDVVALLSELTGERHG